jgi:hypothetical protein
MKKTRNEKRVINIPKENFDAIKKYCDENTLDMVSWIVKNTTEKLAKNIPNGRITANKAREIYEDAINVQFPKDWLDRVLKDIDESVKWAITGCTSEKLITWNGAVEVMNKYRVTRKLPLSVDQVSIVETELHRLGFTLFKSKYQWQNETQYSVGW